jgi:phosphoglycerol transferase MdoB-like AlkP superfamily enzyme
MFTSTTALVRPFLLFALLLIFTLFVARLGFAVWQIERFTDFGSMVTLILNGLKIDLSTLGYLLILPGIVHPLLMRSKLQSRWLSALRAMFFFIFMAVLFFELATPAFINEYGFRPNRLFIEYLAYPDEVMKMLFNGHLLTIVVVCTLIIVPSPFIWRTVGKLTRTNKPIIAVTLPSSSVSFIMLFIVLFLCARGTVGHRPINPSFVYFSTDPLINSLTLNSIYSVAHAYKQFGNEKYASKLYGTMATEQVIKLVRQETGLNTQVFNNNAQPSFSARAPVYQGKPKNLVIILEESLGAQFVSSLGGLPLTPEIDKLNTEG